MLPASDSVIHRAQTLFVSLLVTSLAACSTGSTAMLQTLQGALQRQRSTALPKLNPDFRYLRVTTDGRVALLALGNVDSHPLGPIEVWYSAQKEVLRLQNGRIVGLVGLNKEWRNVSLPALPAWSAVAQSKDPLRWERVRDVMPGYRYGVKDSISLRITTPPGSTAIAGRIAEPLTWFEERVEPARTAGIAIPFLGSLDLDLDLPPARYAVLIESGIETVVYGEQCLARDLCIAWQRWPEATQGDRPGK